MPARATRARSANLITIHLLLGRRLGGRGTGLGRRVLRPSLRRLLVTQLLSLLLPLDHQVVVLLGLLPRCNRTFPLELALSTLALWHKDSTHTHTHNASEHTHQELSKLGRASSNTRPILTSHTANTPPLPRESILLFFSRVCHGLIFPDTISLSLTPPLLAAKTAAS